MGADGEISERLLWPLELGSGYRSRSNKTEAMRDSRGRSVVPGKYLLQGKSLQFLQARGL